MGKRLKVRKALRSLVIEKMINEPHRTNADLGRELSIGASTVQLWASKDRRVQEARDKCRNDAQKQLGIEVERLMKNHMTFEEAKNVIRKGALDDGQPAPGRVQIIRALESHIGSKKAQKLIESRNQERRESKLEPVKAWVKGMPFGEVCRLYSIAKGTLYWRLETMKKPKELQMKVYAKLPKMSRILGPTTQVTNTKPPSDSIFKPGRSELINQVTNNFEGQAAIIELARLRGSTHWYVPANDLHLVAKHLTGGQDTFLSSVEAFIQTSSDDGRISWIDVIWATGKKTKYPIAAFEIVLSGQLTNALARFVDLAKTNPCSTVKAIVVVKPEHVNRTRSEMNRLCFERLDAITTTTVRVLEALQMPHVGGWTLEYLCNFLDVLKYDEKAA